MNARRLFIAIPVPETLKREIYRAETIELIESHLSREGAEYEIVFEQSIEARPR